MAFISPNITKHDIQFLIGDDLGSDHLPIEISTDTQPHRNTHTNPIRYKFDQTDGEVFKSTLEAALTSGDIPELKSTQGIDKYADFIVTAISTAVDKAIPTSKIGRRESQPVSDETLLLIKEKPRLRRQYSQAHDPLEKTHINQLQKEIKDNLRIESQASWEKFCNDISLELTILSLGVNLKTFSNQRVSAIIQQCVSMRKPRRLTQVSRNALPNLLKDTLAFRVITLIQNISMGSSNL